MAFPKNNPQHVKRRREEESGDQSSDSESEVREKSGHWAAWLVVEGMDADRPLSALSPFAVQKGFKGITSGLKSIKRLRNGTFLVECQSSSQSKKMLKASILVDRPIKVSPHKGLNNSKGVIRCPDLKGVSEVEIRDELKSQGVVEVRRAMFRKDKELVPTNTIFLTFCTPTLPQSIKVGYLNVRVTLYVPSPLRCFKCQKFGHVRDRCPGEEACGTCAQAAHEGPCQNPACCVNCGAAHASSSRNCPTWKTEEAIQRVKTEKKISFFEARRLVLSSVPTQSYAQAAKKGQSRSVECQTEISCFRDDIPGLKLKVESARTKGTQSVDIQTAIHIRHKSPVPDKNDTSNATQKKTTPDGGGKVVDPCTLPLGQRTNTKTSRKVSPSARSSGGGGKKDPEKGAVVVDNWQPPPPKPPPKPSPKQALTRNPHSRPGGSADRVKKAESKAGNRFSVLEMEEGGCDAEEEMEKG